MAGGKLTEAIKSGRFVVIGECRPPIGAGSSVYESCVKEIGSMVCAISAPESEDGVRQCSLAACSHLAGAGAEPILHLLTRDMNRIALQANILGAASLGVRNVLCLSGRHQALTTSGTAKGVFDVDPIQLLQIADGIRRGVLVDGRALDSPVEMLLGTDVNPFADPAELHVIALERAVASGADFVVTSPVFDIEKFGSWMSEVSRRGIDSKTCIIASVMPLADLNEAVALTKKYRSISIPEKVLSMLGSSSGLDVAVEMAEQVKKIPGVRGVHVMSGDNCGLAAQMLTRISEDYTRG